MIAYLVCAAALVGIAVFIAMKLPEWRGSGLLVLAIGAAFAGIALAGHFWLGIFGYWLP